MIDATTMVAEIVKGDRSVRDTVAGSITAARAQQERLNVCTLIDEERALERAEALDRLVGSGRSPGPLAGVPIAVKDLIDHAGRTTTCGSGFYRHEADESAEVIHRLEQAGAVVVSRTVLHEFAYGFSSENEWTGPVRNPLDPRLSCGGSSGGSAAAVAAGQVPIALGTDTGGSVRVPAALCGVYGLKVTHGRVPLSGVFPLAPSLDTVGPLAGTVADLALSYAAMAGYHPQDAWSWPAPVVSPSATRRDLQGVRIGIPVPWVDDSPISEEVADAFTEAIRRLRELGAEVEEFRDETVANDPAIMTLAGGEIARIHRTWVREGRPYGGEVAGRLEGALAVTLDDFTAALEWRSRSRQRVAAAFGSFDFLVTPTTGTVRKTIGEEMVETIAGPRPYRPVLSCFTAAVNHFGCPAIVGPLPGGTPPPSLQLIGAMWSEHRLLEVAALLEREGVFQRPGPSVSDHHG
ncbi:MAG TPA: amidase [Acidimicrobiia bacterium]|nr:amidase [Acidimicrobiia bacterium]